MATGILIVLVMIQQEGLRTCLFFRTGMMWPGNADPPASVYLVLGLQVNATSSNIFFFFLLSKAGSHYVALAGLELTMQTKLVSNPRGPPASASWVLELKAGILTLGLEYFYPKQKREAFSVWSNSKLQTGAQMLMNYLSTGNILNEYIPVS